MGGGQVDYAVALSKGRGPPHVDSCSGQGTGVAPLETPAVPPSPQLLTPPQLFAPGLRRRTLTKAIPALSPLMPLPNCPPHSTTPAPGCGPHPCPLCTQRPNFTAQPRSGAAGHAKAKSRRADGLFGQGGRGMGDKVRPPLMDASPKSRATLPVAWRLKDWLHLAGDGPRELAQDSPDFELRCQRSFDVLGGLAVANF